MKSNIVKAASIGMPTCCRRKRRRFVYSSCQHHLKRYVRKTCNSAHQSFGSYGKRPNWEHILQATFRQCADESYRSFDRSRPIHQPCRMGCAIPGVLIRGHVSIFNIRFLLSAAKASSIAAPTELSRMSLTSSERNSFNEKALKEQEHNYHRRYNQTRSRHQQIELNPVHRIEVR